MRKNFKFVILFSLLTLIYPLFFCGAATAASINGTVYDAYDNSTGDYVGEYADAVPVANATVNLMSNNKTLKTITTDNSGSYSFNDLTKGSYTVEISYRTYNNYLEDVTLSSKSLTVNHTFIPDIAIVSYYGTSGVDGQQNKMQTLMDLSCRVYTIDSYNLNRPEDVARHWMLEYANFILVDMYSIIDPAISAEEIANSPANENHMVAYVFGVYTESFLNVISSWNFVGGTDENNTYNTLENTYIGSYWQAEVIDDSDVVKENMQNMLDYIYYLLGETNVNPTEEGRTPLLASLTWGIYHPDYDYGIFGTKPTQEEINEWILADPGYNDDGVGSLNWMTNELKAWSAVHNDANDIFEAFERWYSSAKPDLTGSYVIIASYYSGGSLVDAMIRTYEAEGRAVFNLFQSATSPSISELLLEMTVGVNGTGPLSRDVVAVNSLYSWSLDYTNMEEGGAIDDFTAMNIEIIRAVHGISEYSYTSQYGPQAEWTYAVTIPEFEGVFGAIPVSYIDSDGNEIPVQEGIDKVVELTNGWANLKEKSNVDKKVAVILYDYPPGKAEIGASYLDVFSSLRNLLEAMYDEGYDIGMEKEDIPSAEELYTIIAEFGNKGSWAQGLLDSYVEDNYDSLVDNNQLVDLTQYVQWFNELPESLQEELVDQWGSGLGDIMVYNDTYLVIPGIVCGNVFITVQPSRGWEELVSAEDYHSSSLPPHQQYVSFYKWIDQVFEADTMIHLGTHGTLEWLPGRSIGLQADDWSFQLSTIPNIYPYIVSNPGEAMVAKERGFALVISHMTPAIVSTGLYGDYVELQSCITNYENAVKTNSTNLMEQYKIKIIELAVDDLGLDGPETDEDFDDWLDDVSYLVDDLQNDIITLGLHTLGEALEGDELIQETITIASSRTEILNNIKELLYPSLGDEDYYTIIYDSQYDNYTTVIKEKLTSYITALVNGTSLDDLAAEIGITSDSILYENLNFCVETIADLSTNTEMEAIMTALSGGYVTPGLSGDPSYSDVLPTGTNIYSVDTTKMPSEAAWESAKKIVDQLLLDYYNEHGEFPETVALIMWGTELLRTEGIGIAEFLYLLGVTPVWADNGFVKGVALMDLSELTLTLDDGAVINRPRIDVYATAVTSNADWLELMVTSVSLVNATDESTDVNYVKKHYAEEPSLDRLFGLNGTVLEGTGISEYLPNTNKWEDSASITADLAEIYLSRVSYAWTVDEYGHIVVSYNRDTFEYLLSNTDLVTQNIDSTWRFLDSDDYYDWFGGAVLASQYLGGNPDTSVVDIRDQNNIITRTQAEELNFELRSTLLRPEYMEALFSSSSGWIEYANKYENLFAFDLINKDIDGGNLISDSTWDLLGENMLGLDINADYKAVSFQNMAGWLITAVREGKWNADSKMVTELANKYIESVVQYGVACCHHTCANLNFNNYLIQSSSLSTDMLQEYADILNAATGMELTVGSTSSGSTDTGSTGSESGDTNPESNVGASSAVVTASAAASASSGSSDDSSFSRDSASQSSDSGSSKAYEITQKSSSSSTSSSTPFVAIVGVVCLIGLIGFGYFREDIRKFFKK